MSKLIKTFNIPWFARRKIFDNSQFYHKLEVYDNKLVGHNNKESVTWFYKDYINIQMRKANLLSQYARIVFITVASGNKKERFEEKHGDVLGMYQNSKILGDINKILFCSGMFLYNPANNHLKKVFNELISAFRTFQEQEKSNKVNLTSPSDELKKYKELLDNGAISQNEYENIKKKILDSLK